MGAARALLVIAALVASGCGFHLRGSGGALLPAELQTLRITMPGGANAPIVNAVGRALTAAGGRVSDAPEAPALVLYDERVDNQVITVSTTTGKVNEYRLRYRVSFRLEGSRDQAAPQTVQLAQDYTFDPARLLAKEQEERELVRAMREDAAAQIVRRLARMQKPS